MEWAGDPGCATLGGVEIRPHRLAGFLPHLGPNWFAAVMSTGIVANAAILLPGDAAALHAFATTLWILAALLLAVLLGATLAQGYYLPHHTRRHRENPAMMPFYGTLPMAMLVVGAGALIVAQDLLGPTLALVVAVTLWGVGTVLGVCCALIVPVAMRREHGLTMADAGCTWILPVVPPLVSAATGAALIAHIDDGPTHPARTALLLGCYLLLAVSLTATMTVIPTVWRRMAAGGMPPAQAIPSVWNVLGPFGQSVTALLLLGDVAPGTVGPTWGHALQSVALAYAVPALTVALVWMGVATVITARTMRRHLPFTLAWWSFVFPLGTVVVGTSLLAGHVDVGATALRWLAFLLAAVLAGLWAVVATRSMARTRHVVAAR